MTIVSDKSITIITSTFEAMKIMFDVCGLGKVPAKDVRFLVSIKGEENDKNF